MTQRIHGQTIRWTFSDGPTAGKTFEHTFQNDGTVTWSMVDGEQGSGGGGGNERAPDRPPSAKYELARISSDVFAISFLADSGWTLTSILDFVSGTIVAFASNEKQLMVQHGTFGAAKQAA